MKCRECKLRPPFHRPDCSYDHTRFYCIHCEEKLSKTPYTPYCSDYCKKAAKK